MADSLHTLLGLGDGVGAGCQVFLQCPAWLTATDGLAAVTWRDPCRTQTDSKRYADNSTRPPMITLDHNREKRKYSGQVCPQALRECASVVKLLPVT